MLGILDLRLVGYYKIKQGILQQILNKYYRFESADTFYEQYNKLINTSKRRRKKQKKYSLLEQDDEKKKISDKEMFDKYEDLERSCLSDSEKKQVIDMLYKHKDAFSLRDEIGTCPNIVVEIDVTDKLPFFIRPYHVKEEDKNILHREIK